VVLVFARFEYQLPVMRYELFHEINSRPSLRSRTGSKVIVRCTYAPAAT
jgi:hypothetical protein